MDQKDLRFGSVTIFLPDENGRTFFIFQDLTELFGLEYNSDVEKLLKQKIREIPDLIVKIILINF